MSNDLDALLRAELEKLRQRDPEQAARLLNAALGRPVSAANKDRPTGPAYPQRTQHHTPLESESVFVRFAAWFDEFECQTCQHTWRQFDGLFEERAWKRPEEHSTGPLHWLSVSAKPLPELLKGGVAYARYHRPVFCVKCIGAEEWPLADSYQVTHTIDVQTAREVA